MSNSYIQLATGHNVAADKTTESGVAVYRQRVVAERGSTAGALGVVGAELLAKLLTLDGAGVASDMNVLGAPSAFAFIAAVDTVARVRSITLEVLNGGAYTLGAFAGDVAALAIGLTLQVIDTDGVTVLVDLLAGLTVKRAADWALAGGRLLAPFGADGYLVELDFGELLGEPLALEAGQRIALTVQDDLTGLDLFRGMVHGHAVPTVSA